MDKVFELTQGGVALRAGLTFAASGVRVDNWTNQPVRIRGSSLYCPPFTVGWTIPMPATITAEAEFSAPPGVPLTAQGTVAQTALIIFTEEAQPYSMGVSIAAQGPATQRFIGRIDVAPNQSNKQFTFTLDDSVQALVVEMIDNQNTLGTTLISETDDNRSLVAAPFGSCVIPLLSGRIKHLLVNVSTGAGTDHAIFNLYESFVPIPPTTPPTAQLPGAIQFPLFGAPIVDVNDRVLRALGEVSVRSMPLDGQVVAEPGANAAATATLAAVVGYRWVAQMFDMSLGAGAATAIVVSAQVLDGASVIFSDVLGTTAAIGSTARVSHSAGALLMSSISVSMGTTVPAAGASMFSRAVLSAYLGVFAAAVANRH